MKKTLVLMMIFAFLLSGCLNTNNPTTLPSTAPTTLPTPAPTTVPDTEPTASGTEPSVDPGTEPTDNPGTEPVVDPGTAPGTEPTTEPSAEPTSAPTTEPPHVHSYSPHVVAPTCTETGYTEYICECGNIYTDNETEAHGHDYYVVQTIDATCTDRGYTVYVCNYCDDTYNSDYTTAKGHDYSYEVIEPTTESQGYTLYTCNVCKHKYKDHFIEKLPPCEHEYTCTNIDGTCLEEGHYLYECIYCGHSYKEPNGQGWQEHCYELVEYVAPTPEQDGYTLEVCTVCGYEFKHPIEYAEETVPKELDPYEVARAVAKYINLFRAEQGSTQLTYLPGMSQVAQYRSVQLIDNFEHSLTEQREAHAYYQYGEWVELSDGSGYYTSHTGEAIGKIMGASYQDADSLGEALARGFLKSSGHWAYVGSSKNSYIGVGCIKSGTTWYVCVLVGAINYG